MYQKPVASEPLVVGVGVEALHQSPEAEVEAVAVAVEQIPRLRGVGVVVVVEVEVEVEQIPRFPKVVVVAAVEQKEK